MCVAPNTRYKVALSYVSACKGQRLRKDKKMLKKSLIAIAVLAMVLPAVAGEKKWHEWETQYVSKEMELAIPVILDVGYYIHVVDQDPIEVTQFDGVPDESPYTTYWGCKLTDIVANFTADISGKATAVSAAGGSWSVYFAPGASVDPWADKVSNIIIPKGTTSVFICVLGTDVDISLLEGGSQDVVVAEIDLEIAPPV
jgi:hypothetical protein